MLSTILPPAGQIVLAPEEGGTLLCLWLASHADALLICRTLRQLVVLPSCGVQTWKRAPGALFVIWALPGQAEVLRGLLSAFGDVRDWPARLKLYGDWAELGGQPTYADREYEPPT